MLNRKYNRIFILLNGRNEGVGMNLNGSCDIEIINGTGKLYAYVGGMGRLKPKRRKLYLLSSGIMGTTAVAAGEFEMKGSNAVLETGFDPDNVFGSGMTIEGINAAAVWNSDEGPLRAVLDGYVSQKVNWMKNLEIYGEKKVKREIKNETVEKFKTAEEIEAKILKTTEAKEDENEAVEATLQAAEAAVLDYAPHDTFKVIAERFRRELDMLDEMGIVDKSFILGSDKQEADNKNTVKEDEKPKVAENIIKKDEQIKYQDKNMSEADMLFYKNDKLTAGGDTEWIKIDYREGYFIPNAINDLRLLFVRNGARRGRHMIAGRADDKYYIGVPGNEKQRKSANENGFYDFLTIGDMNGSGYWIKKVD